MNSCKTKKELVSVRIPQQLNKRLAEYLEPKGVSKNAFILGLINRELDGGLPLGAKMKAREA